MTKQEWREKYIKFVSQELETFDEDVKLADVSDFNDIFDFFYSLHLQEIEKIRERIEKLKIKRELPDNVKAG